MNPERMQRRIESGQRLLRMKWNFVVPLPTKKRTFWQWLKDPFPHVHHHAISFPNPETYDWVFTCKCGHTTTNVEEAQP